MELEKDDDREVVEVVVEQNVFQILLRFPARNGMKDKYGLVSTKGEDNPHESNDCTVI